MELYQIILNIVSYAIFGMGGWFAWRSRYNIPVVLSLPIWVVSILIPLLVIDYSSYYSSGAISLLTTLNVVGASFFMFGVFVGSWVKLPSFSIPLRFSDGDFEKKLLGLTLASCLIMTFCFAWVGFVPIFSDDPFLAKYFRGQYKDKYDQIAVFYRFSQAVLIALLPLLFAIYFKSKNRFCLFVLLWSTVLFTLAMTRGLILSGFIFVLAVWLCRTRVRFLLLLIFLLSVYSFGSAVYYILGIIDSDADIWKQIAAGAPDIMDHLMFLEKFSFDRHATYGMTFVGGLVPGNFYYNPSVFTIYIANDGADISQISSGGFRVPLSIKGFIAFGWSGVVLVCLVTGFLTGFFTKKLRIAFANFSDGDILGMVVCLTWFDLVWGFWVGFSQFSYLGVVSLAAIYFTLPNGVNSYLAFRGRWKVNEDLKRFR